MNEINLTKMYRLPNAEFLSQEIQINYAISETMNYILFYSIILLILGFIFGLLAMYIYLKVYKK
jgi:hypothetical protein